MIRSSRYPFILVALLALAACGAPTHPINPPSASIQQLDVLPDGRWKIQFRLENFSDQTVHYATFKADLRVGGEAAGTIDLNPDMDIPGENADIVQTVLVPGADARKAFAADIGKPTGAAYELKGTIEIPAADKTFKFEHKSRLSPVPGIANAYR
jgi:predicted small lipoprotein YifL